MKYEPYTEDELFQLYLPFAGRKYQERLSAVAGFSGKEPRDCGELLERMDTRYRAKTGKTPRPIRTSMKSVPLLLTNGEHSVQVFGYTAAEKLSGVSRHTLHDLEETGREFKGWRVALLNGRS